MESDNERFYITPEDIGCRKWNGYRFFMPTVCVGQVGQLAIDLLLSNLGDKITKIGVIYSDALLPVVGRDPNDNGLCMGLEVYECKEHELIILQQRAPFVKGRIPSFRKKLLDWIKQCCFTMVFVFAGVSSHIRKDGEMAGSPFRFMSTEEELKKKFSEEYKWREYITDGNNHYQLAGSGILKSLYEDCGTEGIGMCAFFIFCNPGNTIREAVQLIEHVQQFTELFDDTSKQGLKMPNSWSFPGDEIRHDYIF